MWQRCMTTLKKVKTIPKSEPKFHKQKINNMKGSEKMFYKAIKTISVAVFAIPLALSAMAKDTVTISVWSMDGHDLGNEDTHRQIIAAFEASHPNIKIDLTLLPESGLEDRMNTAIGAGSKLPDVFPLISGEWRPIALDLSPFIQADPELDQNMYAEPFWRTRATFGDSVVALPMGIGANVVLYNKDTFDKAGVEYPTADWTTEDFLSTAIAVTDRANGIWGGDRPKDAYRAIWHNYDAQVYSDDSKTVEGYHNSPQSLAAYQWYWDLVNSGATPSKADIDVLGTEGTGPVDLFLAGRLGMATLNQSHMLRALKAGINFGMVPEPAGPSKDRHANAWSATPAIAGNTEHPQEAFEFLSFWAGPKGQAIAMNTGLNMFPSIPALWDDHPYIDHPAIKTFRTTLEWPLVRDFDGTHLCWRAALRRVDEVYELIGLKAIQRNEIKAALDKEVGILQTALDDCVKRLGS